MYSYKQFGSEELAAVKEIYRAEDWQAYLRDDEALSRALDNSLLCLGAYCGSSLIGFVRCVGDGEHIVLVQDLIVAPEHRGRGVGTALLRAVWDRYSRVRMFQVITDIEDERDNRFYRSFGMKPISEGSMIAYFRP